jgi:hypothetical protein
MTKPVNGMFLLFGGAHCGKQLLLLRRRHGAEGVNGEVFAPGVGASIEPRETRLRIYAIGMSDAGGLLTGQDMPVLEKVGMAVSGYAGGFVSDVHGVGRRTGQLLDGGFFVAAPFGKIVIDDKPIVFAVIGVEGKST